MFTIARIKNSPTSVPELVEVFVTNVDCAIKANCVYVYSDYGLSSAQEQVNPALFIPVKSYEGTPEKVLGYFVSSDMIFLANYIDNVGGGTCGTPFGLRSLDNSGICDAAEISPGISNTVGFVVDMTENDNRQILVRFTI